MNDPITVLVGVGDEDHALLTRAALENEGYAVETAGSGGELAARLTTLVPSLVIVDVALAAASDWSLMNAIGDQDPTGEVPVVVLTGPGWGDDHAEAWRRGATEVLAELPTPLVLSRVVRDVLDTSAEERRRVRAGGGWLFPSAEDHAG